jgi:hypothetical protein
LTSFVWKRRVGVIGRNDLIGIAISFAALLFLVSYSARYVVPGARAKALLIAVAFTAG